MPVSRRGILANRTRDQPRRGMSACRGTAVHQSRNFDARSGRAPPLVPPDPLTDGKESRQPHGAGGLTYRSRPATPSLGRKKLVVPLMIPARHSMRFAARPSRTRPLSRHRYAPEDRPAGALRADRANPGGGPDPACRGSPQPGRPASFRAEHAAHHTSRPGSSPGSSSSRPRSLGWIRITTVGKTRRWEGARSVAAS